MTCITFAENFSHFYIIKPIEGRWSLWEFDKCFDPNCSYTSGTIKYYSLEDYIKDTTARNFTPFPFNTVEEAQQAYPELFI